MSRRKSLLVFGLGPMLGGFLFALGLGLSGMTNPKKIVGFLDLFGHWDPSLLAVMAAAVLSYAFLYRLIARRPAPLWDTKFHLPTRRDVDRRLVWGSAIFGMGWAIAGLCPGPGLAALVSGSSYAIVFVVAMLLGMFAVKRWDARR